MGQVCPFATTWLGFGGERAGELGASWGSWAQAGRKLYNRELDQSARNWQLETIVGAGININLT